VLDLVRTLQTHGHTVSVCLPHIQRSWIGKAHMIGQTIKPTYYRPPPPAPDHAHADEGTTTQKPLASTSGEEEWLLVDSTPATCVQIGLYHYFTERGPIDLVVSGPNYGRNTTAIFALSSGTLGGALEASVCGVRAVALSYAFFSPEHDADVIAACGRTAVRVIEGLVENWDGDVGLYSVNVPVVKEVEKAKVLWTRMLQNQWTGGSCFKEIEVPEEEDRGPDEEEASIREEEGKEGEKHSSSKRETLNGNDVQSNGQSSGHARYTHKHFKWAPRFKDVYEAVERAGPGNDGWAIKEGHVRSVFAITHDISSSRIPALLR
jgi:tubulin---tyrosine ligase